MGKPRMPERIANAVTDRADGVCEYAMPGCAYEPTQIHHRQLRSQGGLHEVVNCVHICEPCHRNTHGSPSMAYRNGWIVHGFDSPEDEPVLRRGRWVLLHEDGTMTEVEKE